MWNGKRAAPALVACTGAGDVSMDSEVCGISADNAPRGVSDFVVADARIRLARRPGETQPADNQESHFQSQSILYLEDAAGRTGRIRVQCNRPNFSISDDWVEFAAQAVAQALNLRLLP